MKARIQTLEQKGIIEEYTTVINPQKISGAVSCYFEIETAPDCLAQVTQILDRHDTVTQIYRVTGRDKLHVHAVAASAEEMETFFPKVNMPLTRRLCRAIIVAIRNYQLSFCEDSL